MAEDEVHYLYDPEIDTDLDWKLRVLIGTCFMRDPCFRQQRFFHELPTHRWVIYGAEGILAAHVAVHDKILGSSAGDLRTGGVAEVCVHPNYRGQHLVGKILTVAERELAARGVPYMALFGDPKVYSSSGYRVTENSLRFYELAQKAWVVDPKGGMMVKELTGAKWPTGEIDLRGPHF